MTIREQRGSVYSSTEDRIVSLIEQHFQIHVWKNESKYFEALDDIKKLVSELLSKVESMFG